MAGLLESLGQGLQAAGGILSPEVYDQGQKERAQTIQNLRKLQEQVMLAVQNGTAPPEALQRVGISPGLVQPSTESQLAKQQMEMNQQFLQGLQNQQGQMPPSALMSPMGQQYIKTQTELKNLNKPTEHYDSISGEIIRSYPDGRTETVKVGGARPQSVEAKIVSDLKNGLLTPDQARAALKKKDALSINMVGGGQASDLSDPEQLKFWVDVYKTKGTLPPIAWGQAGNKDRELFRKGVAEDAMKNNQTGGEVAASIATFKSNGTALTQLTKDLSAIKPFQEMVEKNGDIAASLADKAVQSNSRLANRPLNWLKQNAGDNPAVATYLAQMRIFQTEAARVLNNPRLVGQLTDSARHEMEQVISGDMPLNATKAVIQRLKTDGTYRVSAMEKQAEHLKDQMSGKTTVQKTETKSAVSLDDYLKSKGY